jgi:hypothetical protein
VKNFLASYINALFGELRDGQQFYKIDLMLDVYWITSLGAIYIQYTGVLATKTVAFSVSII